MPTSTCTLNATDKYEGSNEPTSWENNKYHKKIKYHAIKLTADSRKMTTEDIKQDAIILMTSLGPSDRSLDFGT